MKIETFRKQAKLLLRWHGERNYSVGEQVRLLERFRHLTDAEVLAMPMTLTLAQEVVAVGAGYASWTALKASANGLPQTGESDQPLRLTSLVPILFVRNVVAAAQFYSSNLGFDIDFLHGNPAFYGSVSRDGVCLHLRFVHKPNFASLAEHETSLILASIEVTDVKALFAEFETRGVEFAQRLTRQPWGGLDFQVRDPDGNCISFVEFRASAAP